MASTAKQMVARASAVLTTSLVGATAFVANKAADGRLTVKIDFTKGSLTNVILTPQVSDDNSTWYDVTDPGTLTLTADGTKSMTFPINGWKWARVGATGTGTVTSSLLALSYRWLDKLGV